MEIAISFWLLQSLIKILYFYFRTYKDPENRSFEYFYTEIYKLSYNYFTYKNDYIDYEDALQFQSFLDHYDTDETDVFFNTKAKLKMVGLIFY